AGRRFYHWRAPDGRTVWRCARCFFAEIRGSDLDAIAPRLDRRAHARLRLLWRCHGDYCQRQFEIGYHQSLLLRAECQSYLSGDGGPLRHSNSPSTPQKNLRVRPDILCCAQVPYNSTQHQPDHPENNERGVIAGEILVVFDKPSATIKPAVGALNDPTLGQHVEPLGCV